MKIKDFLETLSIYNNVKSDNDNCPSITCIWYDPKLDTAFTKIVMLNKIGVDLLNRLCGDFTISNIIIDFENTHIEVFSE